MPSPNAQSVAAAAAAAAAGRKKVASMVGRFQGTELFFNGSVDVNTPSTLLIPRTLNLTRPLESLSIFMQGRVAVTAANYTAVAPEAPQNLLQRILLTGTHRAFGAVTPIDISGATMFIWPQLVGSRNGNDVIINGTRVADPGRPFTSGFLGTTAGSPYDITMVIHVPLGPQMGAGQAVKRNGSGFLYFPQDWADSLQLQLQFGDKSALGDPTGATVAFTGPGGVGTNWTLQVHANYSILGQVANTIRGGVTLRQERPLTTFTALTQQARLTALQKRITSLVMLKSGVNQTAGLTAGVQTFASLSDTQLERSQLQVDNKPLKNNQNNLVFKSYTQRMFEALTPQGYFNLPFIEGQNPLLAYRGDELSGGSTYEIISDIASANANNRQSFVQEQIIGGPFSD